MVSKKRINSTSGIEQEIIYGYDEYKQRVCEIGPHRRRNFRYNEFGQPTGYSDTLVDSGKTYGKIIAYGEGNLIHSILHELSTDSTNPGELVEERRYYDNATLTRISMGYGYNNYQYTLWERTKENEMGRTTETQMGTIKHKRTYNSLGRMTTFSQERGTSDVFMHDTYTYQPNGDLYARDCNGRTYQYEHFYSYDANNRLLTYNRDDLAYLTYNNTTGSLTSIPGVSNIYSDDDEYAPYGMKFQDNRYATCEHHIEYNAQNLPTRIEETTSDTIPLFERKILDYVYDGAGDKVYSKLKTQWWYNQNSIYDETEFERYYFHDDYELHNWRGTMKEILYLGGNAYTAPIFLVRYPNERCYMSEEDQTGYTCLWQVGVIGRDLQQNIRSVIIDDSYMAQSTYLSEWGYLEYANGESDPRSSTALFLGRGFGSHEQILEFGLVHMNARMYDPTIGRFLSPDPVIQDPSNTQNFNRYTYCLNNPLKYGDPTGMMSWSYDPEDGSSIFEMYDKQQEYFAAAEMASEARAEASEEQDKEAKNQEAKPSPKLRFLTTRHWLYDGTQDPGKYIIQAGNLVRVTITNQNATGVQLNFQDQSTYYYETSFGIFQKKTYSGDNYSFWLLPLESQTFDFNRFTSEPYKWLFEISTGAPSGVGSKSVNVQIDFYSTWTPDE